jgi:hypothetical protein
MSTPDQANGTRAERPAERALFSGLFDDAAAFPPALVPLRQAVADHRGRQASSYADLVGPLLLPASEVEGLLLSQDLAPVEGPQLDVAVVSRPGTDLSLLDDALAGLNECPGVRVVGVEFGWSPDWHQRKTETGEATLRSVEVSPGAELERVLSDIQGYADDPDPAQAKFRTGATPEKPAPTSAELATFIRSCIDHDVSFKLTGGLHHAVRRTANDDHQDAKENDHQDESQFGFLNVMAATRWALAHGAEVPEMQELLCLPDPGPILDIITRMSAADASVLRAFFTSYGCCAVMDPIGHLAALGLISETVV